MQGDKRTDAESLAEQRPFVEALARKLVLDSHAADDIVQETLLAAMKTPPRRSVRGWLAKVVRNLAYRTLRSEERRRRRENVNTPQPGETMSEKEKKKKTYNDLIDALGC